MADGMTAKSPSGRTLGPVLSAVLKVWDLLDVVLIG